MVYCDTMRRVSYLKPIYFFTSVLPNCGKTNTLTNLAIFLNGQGLKVAILDFAANKNNRKVIESFPTSIQVQDYDPLDELLQKDASRFQRNFFFIETDFISYFPANLSEDLNFLFSDAAFKDFLLQLQSTFDLTLVNLPSGSQYCSKVSEMLAHRGLWQNCTPISSILTNSTTDGLIALDELLQSSSAFNYQLKENTIILFNMFTEKYSTEEGKKVTTSEIKNIFTLPYSYIIPNNEDLDLKIQNLPRVLNHNSSANQITSSLYRIISNTTTGLTSNLSLEDEFKECTSGPVFDLVNPYVDFLTDKVNSKLLITPHKGEVFLEESEDSYALRIRIYDREEFQLGIYEDKKDSSKFIESTYSSPEEFNFSYETTSEKDINYTANDKLFYQTLTAGNVYSFNYTIFTDSPDEIYQPEFYVGEKRRNLAPIFINYEFNLRDIPTLANLLAVHKKSDDKYKKPEYITDKYSYDISGIIPFEIPTIMAQDFSTIFKEDYNYKIDNKEKDNFYNLEIYESQDRFLEFTAKDDNLGESLKGSIISKSERIQKTNLHLQLFKPIDFLYIFLDYIQSAPVYGPPIKVLQLRLEETQELDFTYKPVVAAKNKLNYSFVIPILDFTEQDLSEIKDISKKVYINLTVQNTRGALPQSFAPIDIVYGGEKRTTVLKMHYGKPEITLKKKLVIRRISKSNKSILFVKPDLAESYPPEKTFKLVESVKASFSSLEVGHTKLEHTKVKLPQTIKGLLLDHPICIKLIDDVKLTIKTHSKIFSKDKDFIFSTAYFSNKEKLEHVLTLDSAYLTRKSKETPNLAQNLSEKIKLYHITSPLKINGWVNVAPVNKKFDELRYKIKHPTTFKDNKFTIKEVYEISNLIPKLPREADKTKISTRGMLELDMVYGAHRGYETAAHEFGLQVKIIDFEPLSLWMAEGELYSIKLVDSYRLRTMDPYEEIKVRKVEAVHGNFALDRILPMGVGMVELAPISYKKRDEFKTFLGERLDSVPNLTIKDRDFITSRDYIGLLVKKELYVPLIKNLMDKLAYRALFPQISEINEPEKSLGEIKININEIKGSGDYKINMDREFAQGKFNLKKPRGQYYFQIPLRTQGHKMSYESPEFEAKGANLVENLGSSVFYKQRTKFLHITHEITENISEETNKIEIMKLFNFEVKDKNRENYMEPALDKGHILCEENGRTAYDIRKISKIELLKWAKRTSSALTKKQKTVTYDN